MDDQDSNPCYADEVGELYRDHRARLVAFAARLTRCQADAEDAVQDAFVVALREFVVVRPRRPVAWLTGVTRHRALSTIRGRGRAVPAGDAIEHATDERRVGELTNGGRCLAEPDIAVQVGDLLDRLPLHQRQVLHLWCVDGLDWATVASRLDLPRVRARQIGYRALRRMRAMTRPARAD